MPTEPPRILLRLHYEEAAEKYLRNLPLEHFMEATPQATQRRITLASLELIEAQRPDVHVFNELLVQYPLKRRKRPGQVVPDNMVVIHPGKIKAVGSYDVPLQPVGPFWTLEYVSRSSKRKDYDDNMTKYEHDLKVPYYLLFTPDEEELTLYHHNGNKYLTVLPNEHERYAIPELELEIALLDRWVRYWYRGELLPLPADLLRQGREMQARLNKAEQLAVAERQAREAAETQLAALQAELDRLKKPNGKKKP